MALTYKWFRCIDCGYSGEITTEEIAAHRSKCARGTTEPIAEQARAAEQPDARAWNIVWELAHRDKVFFAGIDGAMARLIEEAQGLLEQPAQPPAANVVERMCSDYGNLTGTDPDPVAMAAALAVAREGYVSLEDVEKKSIALIAKERERQIKGEGWTLDHDDEHKRGELAAAASCYADHANCQVRNFKPSYIKGIPSGWPWDSNWWKPSVDPIRNLVKAGALIAAEIDRLTRLAKPAEQTERVTWSQLANGNSLVRLDGNDIAIFYRGPYDPKYAHDCAERYAAELREELKAGKHD